MIFLALLLSSLHAQATELRYWKDAAGNMHVVDAAMPVPAAISANSKTLNKKEGGTSKSVPDAFLANTKTLKKHEGDLEHVSLKLINRNNSFLVPVRINDQLDVYLVLDTGASVSMLSHNVVSKLGLSSSGEPLTLSTANGMISTNTIAIDSMTVAGLSVSALRVSESELPGNVADGLLGTDFLSHFTVKFDAKSGALDLDR